MTQVFNPFLPSWEYIPDGEPHIFDGRLYLFGSHDRFNGTQFCLNDYVSWSCPLSDLSAWRYEGTIYQKKQDPAASSMSIMQAPDVCRGPDGRYYLYYTLGLSPFMSVAVCDTPAGKYDYYGNVKYSDGTPVGLRSHDVFQFDPGLLADDDGRVWLYSGFAPPENGIFASACCKYQMKGAYVMELSHDMLTVISEPKLVFPKTGDHGFFEASSMRKISGKYYFIYSSQLGHELCWAIGNSPEGPFSFGGILISNGDLGISDTFRNYAGNNHGSLIKINGQWYVFYHRQTNRHQYSRQACAEKIQFIDGKFKQAQLTSCGLNGSSLDSSSIVGSSLVGEGEYEARIACNLWSKDGALFYGVSKTPEAEFHPYFTQSGQDRNSDGDQYIENIRDGATCGFKYFAFDGLQVIGVQVSGIGQGEFLVSTESNSSPICRISVSLCAEKTYFQSSCKSIYGEHALYFTFHGSGIAALHKIILKK